MRETPTLVVMRPDNPGSGSLMGPALARIRAGCEKDPMAETTGEELAEHLLESFEMPIERARYLMLLGVHDGQVVGHVIGRIDQGYENRRHCTIGFYALDKGYRWAEVIREGHEILEEWARALGCTELRLSTYDRARSRLYGLERYGGYEPLFVTMTRRI